MCLVTRQKKAKVLTKDLIAFKMLKVKDSKIKSLCFPKTWKINKVEKTNFTFVEKRHEYSFNDGEAVDKYCHLSNTICIAQGFHASLTKNRIIDFSADERDGVYKVKIPAGSKVYYDCTGLIVSDTMILIDELGLKK